jgi:hypothetical protein
MRLLGAIVSVLLSTPNGNKIQQLTTRLQFGKDAAQEARDFLQDKQYKQAAAAFADALNLGRKPALTLQEIDDIPPPLQQESLDWLIEVCCESSLLQLNHLDNLDAARADAWAACVFSKYQTKKPLDCMMQVCKQGKDLFGEFQTCKQLLDLPQQEFNDDQLRTKIGQRIQEIEQQLSS